MKSKAFSAALTLILVIGVGFPSSGWGQPLGLEQSFVKRYARPGSPTIQVYLWGNVGSSGIWQIEPNLDLIELLSAAQVPGVGMDEPGIRQRITLRIYRTQGGDRREVYSEQLDDIIEEGQSYPSLQEGDILEVELRRRRSISFQWITSIIGTASSLTLLILRLTGNR